MLDISSFKLDKRKDIVDLNKYLVDYIDSFVNQDYINQIFKKYSIFFGIDYSSVLKENKVTLFRNFNNYLGRFENLSEKKNFFKLFIKNIFFVIYIFLFRKTQIKKKKEYDLIIDLTENTRFQYFKTIADNINTIFILNKKNDKFNYLLFKKYFRCSFPTKNSFLSYLYLICWTFFFSIKKNYNFNLVLYNFFKLYFRNHTIFSQIKAKFLIQERYNLTSPIKNEIFKSYGGQLSTCIQRNIFQRNGPGMFIYSDVLFSMGEKSAEVLKDLGGEVKEVYSVGSFFMEYNFHKRNQFNITKNKIKQYDLLFFETSHTWKFVAGYESYYDDFYLHLNWIKKFSQENLDLKIAVKFKHEKDKFENKKILSIIENIDNLEILVDKSEWIDSYLLGQNAKFVGTWSSSLCHELLSIGKRCYYIDPGFRNKSFLPNTDEYKLIRLDTYEKFCDVANNCLIKQNQETINSDNFCLKSEDVSMKIVRFFLKHKINSNNKFL